MIEEEAPRHGQIGFHVMFFEYVQGEFLIEIEEIVDFGKKRRG